MADEILSASVSELVGRMRRRALGAVELVRAHIARIEAVNPALNAVVAARFDAALAEAERADRLYAAGETTPPLLGVPFTVKELIAAAGMPQTFGSMNRRAREAHADATVVARLRAAGAILLGVTNMPEWGMWYESYNDVYGRTCNPYDVQRSPGGSSGGEGCAVGAGMSAFGLGSDIGGSVRMPAAFCGVFGHKPTNGLLPLTGHWPVYASGPDAEVPKAAPYLTVGTFTRSADDIAPLLRVMAGRDGSDPNAEPIAFHDPDAVSWKDRPVVLMPRPAIARAWRADRELADAVERTGRELESRGALVRYAPPDLLERAGDIWQAALQSTGGPPFAELLGGGERVRLGLEMIRTAAGRGRYSWPALYFCIGERIGRRGEHRVRRMMRELRRLSHRFNELVGADGVLICPVHPRTAPRHHAAVLRPFDFLYTAAFNALRVPATSAPAGLDRAGMPRAVQLVAARGNDHLTIAAARIAAESLHGPWHPRPAVSHSAT